MPIADWLYYPSPLYINIGFGLSDLSVAPMKKLVASLRPSQYFMKTAENGCPKNILKDEVVVKISGVKL